MVKNYVLDTNVLLLDDEAFLKFDDNHVILPITVIDELDHLKKSSDPETAYSARCANRALDRVLNTHKLSKSVVELESGGSIHIVSEFNTDELYPGLDPDKNDHKILAIAASLRQRDPKPTVLVTNDIAMKVKARLMGLSVEEYRNIQMRNYYTGRRTIKVPAATIDQFYKDKYLRVEDLELDTPLVPNEFLLLQSDTNSSVIAWFDSNFIVPLCLADAPFSGVNPRQNGQRFAKQALLYDVNKLPLVILKGIAGTAKTFLALAAGLQLLEEQRVRQILLYRPQTFFDDAIGYLPGDEQSKIDPLMRPFYDNLSRLLELKGIEHREIRSIIESYFDSGMIRAEAFTYLQGRSITNSFIIVDEAQNATRLQIKGAITRAGENSKIVLCGDPGQLANPKLDQYNNGLSFASEKMKGSPLCAQIAFSDRECQRSPLTAAASGILV